MAQKIGAGDKPQEYDKSTGRYGNGANADTSDSDFFSGETRDVGNVKDFFADTEEPEKPHINKTKDPEEFHNALKGAKGSVLPAERWRVDLHPIEDYKNDKLFLSDGGSCVAIEPNGNIISVCKHNGDVVNGRDLLQHAIENGGDRLDAFSGLYGFYSKQGFEPVSWIPFDERFAPDGWDKGRDDTEPIIFWKYTGKINKMKYDDFIKTVKPSKDYDTAMSVRDKEMNK